MKKQTETLSVRIEPDTKRKLEEIAERRQLSMGAVIRQLVNNSYAHSKR